MNLSDNEKTGLVIASAISMVVASASVGISLCMHVYGLHWAHADIQEAAHTYKHVQIAQPCEKAEAPHAEVVK